MNSIAASRQPGAESGWLGPSSRNGAVWRATGTPVTPASLAAHGFLRGIPRELLAELAPAASLVEIPARRRLFEDGGHAANFWLIRSGSIALDVHVPGKGWVVIETLGLDRAVGWSWLFPPYIWAFGAVTRQPTEAFQFDGPAVLELCGADPALAYQLTHRFLAVLAHRLQATRMRLLEHCAPPEVWP